MKKKRQIFLIIALIILFAGILVVNAALFSNIDKTKAYHSGTNVNLSINGTARTLQYAVNYNLLGVIIIVLLPLQIQGITQVKSGFL